MKTNDSPPCGCHLTKNMMHLWNLTVRTTYPTVSSVWAHEPWRAHEEDMFLEHLNLGALAASRGSWNPNQLVAHRPAWCKCEQHMMNVEHRGSKCGFLGWLQSPQSRENFQSHADVNRRLCERTGADVKEVARAIGTDSRIGPKLPGRTGPADSWCRSSEDKVELVGREMQSQQTLP